MQKRKLNFKKRDNEKDNETNKNSKNNENTKQKQKQKLKIKISKPIRIETSNIKLRLGYACLNYTISETLKIATVNRSCIQATFENKGAEYAVGLAQQNLKNVLKVLQWNEEHNLRFYRLSSDMLPHCSNPKFIKPPLKYAYDLEVFRPICKQIGDYAREKGHRITYHPGQFCQVGTPTREVFEKTIVELSMHADMLDMMELDKDSVMIIHGGGVYKDKPATIKRWGEQFAELPENVRNRIVIENCEKSYSTLDMLKLSKLINRPIVFDTHHHTCYDKYVKKLPDPSEFLPEVLETWYKLGIKPKFHISEQAPGLRVGAHSDYVENIPDYLLKLLSEGHEIDLMIEAKRKELAVQHLHNKYSVLRDGEFFLCKKYVK
tara:strand:+ start:4548 stop:5678 length:1131 start_codon:yes stop_codon:yes gene_type:complete